MQSEKLSFEVVADTRQFDRSMDALAESTRQFGRVFASAMSGAVRSGKGFDGFLRSMATRLSELALSSALKPLENLFAGMVPTGAGGVFPGSVFSGSGGSAAPGRIMPFARGGVVTSPTLFGIGKDAGLMGEAGPEAILPLRRGSDGRLGVATSGRSQNTMQIVFNVHANDAASFSHSEGQISAMLARAVTRGSRNL